MKFYEWNHTENEKKFLTEVPIEAIANNVYSLNYQEYVEKPQTKGLSIMKMGDICRFEIGGTPSRKRQEYYKNGKNLWVSVRELNGGYINNTKEKITDLGVEKSSVKLFEKDTILFSFKLSIGKTAIAGVPLYSNEAIAGIMSKDTDKLLNKYLYYFLTMKDFSNSGTGIFGSGSLNKESLKQIEIIVPTIEKQKEIIKFCENKDIENIKLKKQIEKNNQQVKNTLLNLIEH